MAAPIQSSKPSAAKRQPGRTAAGPRPQQRGFPPKRSLLDVGGAGSSTSSFKGQATKFSIHGKVLQGKKERRKELSQICMMHPNTFVAQTSCAMPNHFYKSILADRLRHCRAAPGQGAV